MSALRPSFSSSRGSLEDASTQRSEPVGLSLAQDRPGRQAAPTKSAQTKEAAGEGGLSRLWL